MSQEPETLIIFDLEATGLSKFKDRIIEIGAVKLQNRKIVDKFSTFIDPKVKIPSKITELTGITDEMVEGQPSLESAIIEFHEFIGNHPLLAHNATFDMGFIENAFKKYKLPLNNKVYDSLKIAREILPNLQKHDLGTLTYYLQIENPDHHRALNDAEVLSDITKVLLESIKRRGTSIDEIQDKGSKKSKKNGKGTKKVNTLFNNRAK